jgi:hypothetical protein
LPWTPETPLIWKRLFNPTVSASLLAVDEGQTLLETRSGVLDIQLGRVLTVQPGLFRAVQARKPAMRSPDNHGYVENASLRAEAIR